jgi:nitrogen fixation NifU-like protein
MADLRDLYQQIILDHNRSPRNFRKLEGPTGVAEGNNPLCGDQITVYLKLENDIVTDVTFQGSGCAISRASASLMTTAVKGKSRSDAEELFRRFQAMVVRGEREEGAAALGKLAVFSGVREFPVRVKCANLPWHTLRAALGSGEGAVSTE